MPGSREILLHVNSIILFLTGGIYVQKKESKNCAKSLRTKPITRIMFSFSMLNVRDKKRIDNKRKTKYRFFFRDNHSNRVLYIL